jgi:hypothetical protein
MKDINPQQLLGHGRFHTLLKHSEFIEYCKKRGVHITKQYLETFEKLGIFLPLIRISYPKFQRKIERITENTYERLGILEDGEIWNGETEKDYGYVYFFDNEEVNVWIEEGLIFIPTKKTFQPWKNFQDEDGGKNVESFYSMFQILSLKKVMNIFRLHFSLANTIEFGNTWNIKTFRKTLNYIKSDIKEFSEQEDKFNEIAKICQIISNRYLPFAESNDRVTIQLSIQRNPVETQDFDFFEYCQNWNAQEILIELGLTIEEIKAVWQVLIRKVDESPISAWRELIDFVDTEQRNKLKDEALLAETYCVIAKMLNLFHKELTGELLYSEGIFSSPEKIHNWREVFPDDFQYMEFVVNEYGLNPKPKLILFVEGESEFVEIPKLVKSLFGKSLTDYRILINNLNSIGEFVGKKSKTSEELKIERFIDYFHDAQTIVYFIIDDENNAKQVKDILVRKKSQYADKKTITKEEFFKVWVKNIEFDNFTDEEIAQAMTRLCENRYIFQASEVKSSRDSFGTKELITLTDLYKEKSNYGLNKPELLSILFDCLKSKHTLNIDNVEKVRPIIEVIDKITHLAIKNYQPTRLQRWKEAQDTGWIRDNYE